MTDEPSNSHRRPARLREVYDNIANHFAKTRHSPWPEVRAFLEDANSAAVGLDIGCGNGRHTELLAERCDLAVGVDLSGELLGIARAEVGNSDRSFVQGSATDLPLQNSTVELGLYIATLHHLPDRDARVRSLSDLSRVLAPGGRALVSVWSTTHDRFEAAEDTAVGFDTTVDWTLPDGETVRRFYHIYAPAEFKRDIDASNLTLEDSYVSSGNCYAEVRG